jgi:YfiH family protein
MTLPTPDSAFHWTSEVWGQALRCKRLTPVAQHAFTTKQLELRAPAAQHRPGWAQAAASVGARVEHLVRVKQVHGAVVHVVRNAELAARDTTRPEADAIVSNMSGLVLSVQVADCVPLLLADRETGVVAAVHAGWRGTCAGVARSAVDAMAREFGASASNLIAAIGPSIGPCCYTVGENVRAAFRRAGARDDDISRWFLAGDDGSLRLDLWAANRDQLIGAGLNLACVQVARLCTLTHRDVFESYRADGERAGRMAALIAVP